MPHSSGFVIIDKEFVQPQSRLGEEGIDLLRGP
jgi:hypothetical protein